ncbi:MAG TPA: O-antigen ligase family protein [Phenylobacterium sp.]|uniref:O-antigen ligase family protein n=1 Tax=Phenylobacterium sp. TaxID=1871053 RepID=UPI002F91EBDF
MSSPSDALSSLRSWWTGITTKPIVLNPYTNPRSPFWRPHLRWVLVPAFILFCFLYGFLHALTAPYMLVPMAFPVVALAIIAIWALPDSRHAPTAAVEVLFFTFFIGLIMWPNYLAFSPPGLPWITMIRLVGFPTVLLLLVSVSVSGQVRHEIRSAITAVRPATVFLIIFATVQFLTIPLSGHLQDTANKVVLAQVSWTAMFFTGCYVFLKPGRPERWAALLWVMAILIGLVGLMEGQQGQVLWVGHIPNFLAIEDEAVLRILGGQQRAAIGVHRVQATFSTSLGLAEFLALCVPFIIHFAFGPYRLEIRVASALSVPFLLYTVWLTDSRLGMVGFLLGSLTYMLFWSALRWRRSKGSIFGPAITLSYPVIFTVAVAATFFVGRIRNEVWGTGANRASNQGRISQYQDAIPLILKHPLGHGMGQGAEALGHRNPVGILTIDTYYMTIGLDYGIMGMVAFYGMLIATIYYTGKYAISILPKSNDVALLMPLSVALVNFLVIKSVFSQQDNHPIIFMMIGMAAALVYRARAEKS